MIDYEELNYSDYLELDSGYQNWLETNMLGSDGFYHYYGESLKHSYYCYDNLNDNNFDIITKKEKTSFKKNFFDDLNTIIMNKEFYKIIPLLLKVYEFENLTYLIIENKILEYDKISKYDLLSLLNKLENSLKNKNENTNFNVDKQKNKVENEELKSKTNISFKNNNYFSFKINTDKYIDLKYIVKNVDSKCCYSYIRNQRLYKFDRNKYEDLIFDNYIFLQEHKNELFPNYNVIFDDNFFNDFIVFINNNCIFVNNIIKQDNIDITLKEKKEKRKIKRFLKKNSIENYNKKEIKNLNCSFLESLLLI